MSGDVRGIGLNVLNYVAYILYNNFFFFFLILFFFFFSPSIYPLLTPLDCLLSVVVISSLLIFSV